MPTCQQTMSVTRSGPLTSGPIGRRPRRRPPTIAARAPRGALGRVLARRSRRSARRSSARLDHDRAVLLALPGLRRARCGSSGGTARRAPCRPRRGTHARSTRGLPARRTRWLVVARRRARCAARSAGPGRSGAHHSRATGGVEGVHAAQRIALHRVALLVGDARVTSSSPMSVSPPTSARRRDAAPPERVLVA